MLRCALQRVPGRAEQGQRVGRLVGSARRIGDQRLVRGRCGGVQGVSVRQPLGLGMQLHVLAVNGLEPLDLGQPAP